MRIIVLLIVFISNCCIAQTNQSGLILPDFTRINENDVCCIYIPKDGFLVYNAPKGKKIGELTRLKKNKEDDQTPYKLFLRQSNNGLPKQIDLTNFYQIGYEVWAIQYLERKDNYIRVNGLDLWIKENEIRESGFYIINWQEYFSTNASDLLGLYPNEPGLNLRKAPNSSSELIKTLKGDLYEIKPLDQNSGSWTKVKVKKYKEHPCLSDIEQSEIIEYELEGWIKMVDDNGLPNVWFYSRGC